MPDFDEYGHLIWTKRLTAIVVGAAALLGLGAGVAYQVGEAGIVEPLGLIAAVALIVAVGGRAVTARNERWAGITEPTLGRVWVRRGRVVITRRDVAARIMLGITGCGWVLVAWDTATDGTAEEFAVGSAAFGLLTILFFLLSFGSRVVVTPTDLVVCTGLTRRVIPRHLVGRIRGTGRGAIAIAVAGEREVPVGTGVHAIWSEGPRSYRAWNHRPAELKAASRIKAALAAVPAHPSGGGTVVLQRRTAMIGATAFALVALMLIVVWSQR